MRTRLLPMILIIFILASCAAPLPTEPAEPAAPSATPVAPAADAPAATLPPTQPPASTTTEMSPASPVPPTSQAPSLSTDLQAITRGKLEDIALSPDGKWLAAASASGVYLHDAATLAYVRPLLQGVWVSGLAFSSDGKRLAIGGYHWAALLDFETGKELARLEDLADWVTVAFGPGEQELLVFENPGFGMGATSTALYTWNPTSGEKRPRSLEAYGSITAMATSPDGAQIAVGTDVGRIELFSWTDSTRQAILADSGGAAVTDLAYSQDGSLLAAAYFTGEGLARVWEVGPRNRQIEEWTSGWYSLEPYVAFSVDNQRLFSGTAAVGLAWDRQSKKQVGQINGYASDLIDLTVSPDGQQVAWATHNGLAFVRPIDDENATRLFSVLYEHSLNVTFAPDGLSLFAGQYSYAPQGSSETVRRWEIASGAELANYPGASAAAVHNGPQYLFEAPPVLALADQNGKARLLDLNGGGELAAWQFPENLAVMKMTFSNDGTLLGAWGVANGWPAHAVWNMAGNSQHMWHPGGDRPAFSPDGQLLAVPLSEIGADHIGPARYSLLLTPLHGKRPDRQIDLLSEGSAAYIANGALLALGVWQGEASLLDGYPPDIYDPQANGLLIFDANTLEQLLFLPLPRGLSRLAPAPDGAWLAAGGPSGEIWIYSATK